MDKLRRLNSTPHLLQVRANVNNPTHHMHCSPRNPSSSMFNAEEMVRVMSNFVVPRLNVEGSTDTFVFEDIITIPYKQVRVL